MKRFVAILSLLLIAFSGCGPNQPKKTYRVGVDPSYFPFNFEGKLPYVLAFTNELLSAIGQERNIRIQRVQRNWDTLIYDLKHDAYDGILSAMDPILTNEAHYNFSKSYLDIGPVLITDKSLEYTPLDKMENSYIAVIPRTKAALFVETQPNLMAKYYSSSRAMCQAVENNEVNGALVESVAAISLTHDIFQDSLEIRNDPMFNEGLRLVILKESQSDFIEEFNEGLKQLKRKGVYAQLLKKWDLAK